MDFLLKLVFPHNKSPKKMYDLNRLTLYVLDFKQNCFADKQIQVLEA
jgi:hypothetical protein